MTRGSLTLGIRAESSRWISSLMRQFDCLFALSPVPRYGRSLLERLCVISGAQKWSGL